jgi:hypothetical protein
MSEPRLLYPEDWVPFGRLVPMGLQHVVAMFGATMLAAVNDAPWIGLPLVVHLLLRVVPRAGEETSGLFADRDSGVTGFVDTRRKEA